MGGDRFPRRFEVSVSDPKTVPTMGAPDASDAVYDARTLGAPKMTVFGI